MREFDSCYAYYDLFGWFFELKKENNIGCVIQKFTHFLSFIIYGLYYTVRQNDQNEIVIAKQNVIKFRPTFQMSVASFQKKINHNPVIGLE